MGDQAPPPLPEEGTSSAPAVVHSNILLVCIANQCRSPMAELMLRSALQARFGKRTRQFWTVGSAGVHTLAGTVTHPLTIDVLVERGIFTGAVPARQISSAIIEAADLILTSDREQRAAVAKLVPSAVRRTFMLRQFARMCAAGRAVTPDLVVSTARDLERLATVGRSRVQPGTEDDDLIPDPIGGGIDDFRDCADIVENCVVQILGPSPGRPPTW